MEGKFIITVLLNFGERYRIGAFQQFDMRIFEMAVKLEETPLRLNFHEFPEVA